MVADMGGASKPDARLAPGRRGLFMPAAGPTGGVAPRTAGAAVRCGGSGIRAAAGKWQRCLTAPAVLPRAHPAAADAPRTAARSTRSGAAGRCRTPSPARRAASGTDGPAARGPSRRGRAGRSRCRARAMRSVVARGSASSHGARLSKSGMRPSARMPSSTDTATSAMTSVIQHHRSSRPQPRCQRAVANPSANSGSDSACTYASLTSACEGGKRGSRYRIVHASQATGSSRPITAMLRSPGVHAGSHRRSGCRTVASPTISKV